MLNFYLIELEFNFITFVFIVDIKTFGLSIHKNILRIVIFLNYIYMSNHYSLETKKKRKPWII